MTYVANKHPVHANIASLSSREFIGHAGFTTRARSPATTILFVFFQHRDFRHSVSPAFCNDVTTRASPYEAPIT